MMGHYFKLKFAAGKAYSLYDELHIPHIAKPNVANYTSLQGLPMLLFRLRPSLLLY